MYYRSDSAIIGMLALTSEQRASVQCFIRLTSMTEHHATSFLDKCDWLLERGVDKFFGTTAFGRTDVARFLKDPRIMSFLDSFDKIFDHFKCDRSREPIDTGVTMDVIDVEGIGRILVDEMEIPSLEDPVTLVLMERMRCREQGWIYRSEFLRGMWCIDKGMSTLHDVKKQIPAMRKVLTDPSQLKEVYLFTFKFSLTGTEKRLPKEVAVDLWRLLLLPFMPALEAFCDYVMSLDTQISKDTWNMMWSFTQVVKPDFSNYSVEDGAWPVILDNFVTSYRNKQLAESQERGKSANGSADS